MKTLKVWLLALFLASPIFLYSNFTTLSGKAFRVVVSPAADASAIRLDVLKAPEKPVLIQLLDGHDDPVASHTLDAPVSRAQIRLNVQELPAGKYRLVVTDHRNRQVRRVIIDADRRAERRMVIRPAQ